MDSGFIPPGDSFDPDFDVCRGLEGTEVIWIIDQLLCLEIAWHDGYPLSQTVFTSLHVDRLLSPDNRKPYTFPYGRDPGTDLDVNQHLVHTVLGAYCLGLVKCIQVSLQIIQSQNFYEEEDFVTHLFGRDLLEKLTVDDAAIAMEDALKCVMSADLASGVSEAIEKRLWFRRNYLALLIGETDDWSLLVKHLAEINVSHPLAATLPDAFSDKVQRQLATSTPPRPMLEVSWDDSFKKWNKICSDAQDSNRLTSFWVCQSPHGLQRAMWAFAYREPQPGTFARAYLQDRLLGGDKLTENLSYFDLLLTDMRDLVLAGDILADPESFQVEVPTDPRHLCSRIIESFMDRAFEEYLNVYRMVCQNRCRIRRTFTQTVPILDSLETVANQTDEELHHISPQRTLPGQDGKQVRLNPLTSWTRYYKTFVMARTIQLGVETEIYLPDELCMMYWLLSILSERQCQRLQHVEGFLIDRMRALTKSRNSRYVAETLASQDWIQSLQHLWNATRLMSSALYRLCGILMDAGVLQPLKRDYAQSELLWDARMKPYLNISHDPIPTLEDFQRSRKELGSLKTSCAAIDESIKEAKRRLAEVKVMSPQQAKYFGTEEQWKREMKQLETTCVATAVQTTQLLRLAEKHDKKDPELDDNLKGIVEAAIPEPGKRYHLWWVVPQIKERRA